MTEAPRCVVADDHPALTAAVTAYLSAQRFHVLGPAPDGVRALALVTAERPELALVDWRMPRLSGLELIHALREASPETALCVYTADADAALAAEAQEAGARGLVLKESPLGEIVRALETILAGNAYLDPAVAATRKPTTALTQRELDVLALLAEGLPHEEIGRRLGISSETVRTHLRKASGRLGAATRTQAVATALRMGLLA
jgi:DNA-binding NarL/FixJ family response regulator